MSWISMHAKFDSKCHYCQKAHRKGDRVVGLPPEKTVTGKWVVACLNCFNKVNGLAGPEKAKKPAKAATLSEIMKGVASNYPDEPRPDDALDRLVFEGYEKKSDPHEKEVEKYSLAWFATRAQWQFE